MRTCTAGAMLSPWRAGREAARLPGRFSCRTALTALLGPTSSISMIDKVLLSGISATDRGWQIPRSSWESIHKKTQKAAGCPMGRSQTFCAFIFVPIPFSQVIASLRSYSRHYCFPKMAPPVMVLSLPADSAGQTAPLLLSFRPTMLHPQMLRPKYRFSLPCGAVPVNLRFPQGQEQEHTTGDCEDAAANLMLCDSAAAAGAIKLNCF